MKKIFNSGKGGAPTHTPGSSPDLLVFKTSLLKQFEYLSKSSKYIWGRCQNRTDVNRTTICCPTIERTVPCNRFVREVGIEPTSNDLGLQPSAKPSQLLPRYFFCSENETRTRTTTLRGWSTNQLLRFRHNLCHILIHIQLIKRNLFYFYKNHIFCSNH